EHERPRALQYGGQLVGLGVGEHPDTAQAVEARTRDHALHHPGLTCLYEGEVAVAVEVHDLADGLSKLELHVGRLRYAAHDRRRRGQWRRRSAKERSPRDQQGARHREVDGAPVVARTRFGQLDVGALVGERPRPSIEVRVALVHAAVDVQVVDRTLCLRSTTGHHRGQTQQYGREL